MSTVRTATGLGWPLSPGPGEQERGLGWPSDPVPPAPPASPTTPEQESA